ncbi:hypothetical protein HOY34_16890 [Xinfangfangia sp. D13-10-4-6]|uniref:hypothetical protein n=1 Tax=Pseudogemmobacter hezensis TaxID=2737662 RepID=UPI00155228F3|nr:hypothetical protein [Pseudogemmobacter hezensis]NPD16871.1 hypothetical protein [Pseudogemmobacter hezensis]
MSRIPGSSYSLLAFYLFLTALGCLLIGGIVPMMVMLAGLAMTIRRSDWRYMQNAGRFIAWFYGVAAVICLLVAGGHLAALSSARFLSLSTVEHQYYLWFFGMACLLNAFGWALTKHALLPAFQPWRRSIAAHGFWGNLNREGGARNRLAIELMKWSDLREAPAHGVTRIMSAAPLPGIAA